MPNLLFYGPPGTGKTSTILALARQIYRDKFKGMILQLNASDDRGINVVRDSIKDFASTGMLDRQQNALKLVILDQADSMTNAAQFALRRIIQKYWRSTRFCIICNYVSKIIPALQSRCTRFKFGHIAFENAQPLIQEILTAQKMQVGMQAQQTVFRLCQGDMRRVVNMLQSIKLNAAGNTSTVIRPIEQRQIYQFTNSPSPLIIQQFFKELIRPGPLRAKLDFAKVKLLDHGISIKTLLKELAVLSVQRLNKEKSMQALVGLGEIEYRLSLGCQERIQLGSLIGVFAGLQSKMQVQ